VILVLECALSGRPRFLLDRDDDPVAEALRLVTGLNSLLTFATSCKSR